MTPGFLLWALAVSALCGAAGAAASAGLRAIRGPTRAVRFATILLSVAIPAWALLHPAEPPAPVAPEVVVGFALDPGDPSAVPHEGGAWPGPLARGRAALTGWLSEAAPAGLATPRPVLGLLLWGAATAGLLLLAGGLLRLHRRSAGWRPGRVRGRELRLAEDFGPAVVGAFRSVIVLPRTILRLEAARLEVVLRHEESHRHARDPLLLWLGALLVCLAPWNPILWWQLGRLRDAVEYDCDGRVLRSGVAPRRYARLLLDLVSARRSTPLPAAPALLESSSSLERRLRSMKRLAEPKKPLRAALLTVAAGLLAFAACDAPAPTVVEESPAEERRAGPTAFVGLTNAEKAAWIAELEAADPAARWQVRGRIVRAIPEGSNLETVVGLKRFDHPDGEGRVFQLQESPLPEGGDPTRLPPILPDSRKVAPPPPTPGTTEVRVGPEAGRPLVVVDGVITDLSLSELTARVSEIRSIEVVRGSSAREAYGPRAADGVVEITTKAGAEAGSAGPPKPTAPGYREVRRPGDREVERPAPPVRRDGGGR